ncbi:hypothetical protein EJ05DRAFT_496815 [Pseudovirgaria hyperparasitica]|uniref:FAM192A/Fyv6 N-terminal domain-containing protein n=1 Tax=Pseudovirgaria hyperparasitica TaxID=470096 RepID=A0A6A6WGJ2_9PEZI|nr:uncharacterized protein EJ05DRAFT_496815 [Pseudovirgaria hyperparasitica]KAF2761928.1 hypothetical protein EJ05DRAFT_496815 [Pseudovirgaria hyperparasitica]
MSKFVSGGTIDEPLERDEEWRKAHAEIEAAHLRRLKEGQQEGGKSLYEVLQANKGGKSWLISAAKQDAFEESIRLKNQFRSLDEDEVDFLDKVLESTRAKEAAVRKETSEQLELFRRQQEEIEKNTNLVEETAVPPSSEEHWVAGRKRKKGKESDGLIKGLKLRKTSSAEQDTHNTIKNLTPNAPQRTLGNVQSKENDVASSGAKVLRDEGNDKAQAMSKSPTPAPPKANGLGLADYSSDEN